MQEHCRRWSSWRLAQALAGFILRTWVPQGPVRLVGDDTVDEHHRAYAKLSRPIRVVLLYALAPAA